MTKQRLFIGGGCHSLLISTLHKAVKGGDV